LNRGIAESHGYNRDVPDPSVGTAFRHWLQAPRYLLLLFLATTLGFLVGLAWLGLNSIRQDETAASNRASEARNRAREYLVDTTDTIAVEVRRPLSELAAQIDRFSTVPDDQLDDAIASWAERLPRDALVVVFDARRARAFPRTRLLYYPVPPVAGDLYLEPGVPNRAYATALSDPRSAVEIFELLVAEAADDVHVRAEALLGLGNVQRDLGQTAAALATYAEVTDPDAVVDGRPAELLARFARCKLLADLSRTTALRDELGRLVRDIHSGRWQMTRGVYQDWAAAIARLGAGVAGIEAVEPSAEARSLAAGVDLLWRAWTEREENATLTDGPVSRILEDRHVVLLSRATRGRLVALVAGTLFLDDRIIGPIRGIVDARAARVVLDDGERTVLSYGAIAADENPDREVRTMADTRLPWTLNVYRSPSAVDGIDTSSRRQLIVAGLVFLALFVVAGSYLSVRAVTREIEAARLKSDFVAAVSHEFRTPLTLLRQFSDLLAEDRVSSEQERRQYYAALQRGTRRLTRLVEDLLDFGRMEAGSRGFTMQPVAAREWLLTLTDEFQEDVRGKGFTIEVTWAGPPVLIAADEAALGRALWNLLDNAVKYSPVCRTIWVTGGLEEERLVVGVRDRGLGVPPRERRTIFRKFVRGSTGDAPPVGGSGLGLSLVEQIVEAHGGEVRLESEVGEGSTFSLVLPATVVGAAEEGRTWRAS
jgi:signal transduction histidine kinase